jgi:TolA-binding protein
MKKIMLFVMIFTAASVFACASFYGNMIEEDAYLKANANFNNKDYEGAANDFTAFLEKFPESKYRAAALLKMAELSENIEDSIKYYNTVINDYPKSESEAEAVFDLAKLFYAQGGYKKAHDYFNVIISKFPSMIWAEESYYMIILCSLEEKDASAVEKAYSEYNDKKFFTIKDRVNAAYAGYLMSSGNYLKALDLYREVIAKTSDKDKNIYMPLVYKNAAEAAKNTGDTSGAEKLEGDLKLKYPDSPEAKGTSEAAIEGQDAGESDYVTIKADNKKTVVKRQKTGVKTAPKEFYTIQIGAYSNKKICDLTAAKFQEKKYDVFVKKDGKFYKISLGRYGTKAEAEAAAPQIAKKERLKSYLVKQVWEK